MKDRITMIDAAYILVNKYATSAKDRRETLRVLAENGWDSKRLDDLNSNDEALGKKLREEFKEAQIAAMKKGVTMGLLSPLDPLVERSYVTMFTEFWVRDIEAFYELRGKPYLLTDTKPTTPIVGAGVARQLNLPNKPDIWAKAIVATAQVMLKEGLEASDAALIWTRMLSRPPAGFPIIETMENGFPAAKMASQKNLTRDGFMKRWARYFAPK